MTERAVQRRWVAAVAVVAVAERLFASFFKFSFVIIRRRWTRTFSASTFSAAACRLCSTCHDGRCCCCKDGHPSTPREKQNEQSHAEYSTSIRSVSNLMALHYTRTCYTVLFCSLQSAVCWICCIRRMIYIHSLMNSEINERSFGNAYRLRECLSHNETSFSVLWLYGAHVPVRKTVRSTERTTPY